MADHPRPTPPDDALRAYIEKVLDLLHRDENTAPTPIELAAVAKELGLTAADQARLESTAADALARGLGFLEHGRPRDAAPELETAVALRPHDVPTLHALAAARAEIALTEGDAAEDAAARALVRRTLVLDPRHKDSFQLLNRLDAGGGGRGRAGGKRTAGPSPGLRLVAAVALIVAVVLAGVLLMREAPRSAAVDNAPAHEGLAEAPPSEPNARPSTVPENVPAQRLFPESLTPDLSVAGDARVDTTLGLDPAFAEKKLGFDLKAAWFNRFPEHAYFNAWVLLKNDTGEDVTELKAETQFLDSGGKVLSARDHFVVISVNTALRPGDTVPVKVISEVPAATTTAQTRLVSLKTRPVKASAPAQPVALVWAVPRPADVAIELAERWVEVTENTSKGGFWHKVVFEVRNTGTTPLHVFKLNVRRFDANDTMLEADELNVAWSLDVPLFVGETRLVSSLGTTATPVKRYAVEVINATAGLQF